MSPLCERQTIELKLGPRTKYLRAHLPFELSAFVGALSIFCVGFGVGLGVVVVVVVVVVDFIVVATGTESDADAVALAALLSTQHF